MQTDLKLLRVWFSKPSLLIDNFIEFARWEEEKDIKTRALFKDIEKIKLEGFYVGDCN